MSDNPVDPYEVWDFLTEGKPPVGLIFKHWKPLPVAQAFSIFYALQEAWNVLPDTFEYCYRCHCLINTEEESMGRRKADGATFCEMCDLTEQPYEGCE